MVDESEYYELFRVVLCPPTSNGIGGGGSVDGDGNGNGDGDEVS